MGMGGKLFKKRVDVNENTNDKGKGERRTTSYPVNPGRFLQTQPRTCLFGADASPDMHARSLQPHEAHGDPVNGRRSDCRFGLQVL